MSESDIMQVLYIILYIYIGVMHVGQVLEISEVTSTVRLSNKKAESIKREAGAVM